MKPAARPGSLDQQHYRKTISKTDSVGPTGSPVSAFGFHG
ncbi:hypothetical protein I551_6526 [Mycobacterium ulcerans str. Harvey]|uniref:Uncharacterized protein n=1 Tax=Mycobacterium ulcerans str. Harvey TaxID=1299332 RepID=A0ABP3A6Q5_MYCUL|nr:hypothetical protein I551_6526 [Mycobacterium ulcerans str. Harvey]